MRIIDPRSWKDARVTAKQVATACHCDRLRRAARVVTGIYDAWLAPTGIRLPELTLLSTIWSASDFGIAPAVLADRMGTHRTTITRAIQTAARHGFLLKEGPYLQLSPRGADKVTEAMDLWQSAEAHVLIRMSGDEQRGTREVLDRLIHLANERWEPIPESG